MKRRGRDHPIQVTLPAGSYVPVFIHKPEEKPSPTPPGPPEASESEPAARRRGDPIGSSQAGNHLAFAVVLAFAALGLYLYRHTGAHSAGKMVGSSQAPASIGLNVSIRSILFSNSDTGGI